MKDPLQTQPTPYEILGVSPSATASEIDEAFKMGLVKRGNVQKLTGAKRTLERPLDRALLDLFLYDDAVLAKLGPDPLCDPSALDSMQRASTADAWQTQLRKTFPDPAIAHALGVLWYWSACNASEHLNQADERDDSDTPTWDALWQSAIGCWVFTITNPDFWRARSTARVVEQKDLQVAVTQRLASDLQRFMQSHRDAQHADVAARFQQLEMALTTELKTAKALLTADVRNNRGVFCAGKLMLQRMDLVEKIRFQIEAALTKSPGDETLLALRDDLSPYGDIAALISNRRPDAAIEAIEKLPPKKRKLPEVRKLEARARFERGKQFASVNNINDALDCWGKALECAQSDDEQRTIREEAESTCIHLTASMQSQQQRDEAIRIVEKGLKAVQRSEKLSLKLADLLMQRGIETINEGQKQTEKEGQPSEAIIKMIERGVADLERAAALGSKRAAEQAEVARDVLTQIKGAHVPADVIALFKEAEAAAGREDWDRAIEKLRAVLKKLGAQAPEQIRKNLATMLANRGISLANKAVQSPGPDTLERLNSALSDLREAAQLDPSSEHIRENLRGIEAAIAALEGNINKPNKKQPKPDKQRPSINIKDLIPGSILIVYILLCLYLLFKRDFQNFLLLFSFLIAFTFHDASSPSPAGCLLAGVLGIVGIVTFIGPKVVDFLTTEPTITIPAQQQALEEPTAKPNSTPERPPATADSNSTQSSITTESTVTAAATSAVEPAPSPAPPPTPAAVETTGASPAAPSNINNTVPPILISRVIPRYPKAAKSTHVEGNVVIEMTINQKGAVTNARVVKGLQKSLDKAALNAVRQWKFKPAMTNGQPVKSPYSVTIHFQPGVDFGTPIETVSPSAAAALPAPTVIPPNPIPTPVTAVAAPPGPVPAPAWLDPQILKKKPEVDQVTAALAQLDRMPLNPDSRQQLKADVDTLQQRLPSLPFEVRPAVNLLIAAALEKLGDRTAALSYYHTLTLDGDEHNQYNSTSKLRKSEMEISDPDELEELYGDVLKKAEVEGWFRTAGSWERTTTHRAAWLGLARLHKDKTPVSLFNWLRSQSVFPIPYAYLFVLIVLTLVAKIIELPVLIRVARLNLITSRLGSEIARIKQETAGDPMKMNSRIAELYKWHGVNPASGCLLIIIEIAFFIGVWLSLRAWVPQMTLDGAKFFWVADILQPNYNLLIAWIGIGLFMILITPPVAGAAAAKLVGGLFGLSIIAVIAWFFDWPAYVMIFLMLLGSLSTFINRMLMGFLKTRG